jgi:hypothetical protein
MPEEPQTNKGELRAILREVEPGLFRAEYLGEINPDHPDARAIPDAHVSTTPEDAKIWVEQMARSLGYSRVVWE